MLSIATIALRYRGPSWPCEAAIVTTVPWLTDARDAWLDAVATWVRAQLPGAVPSFEPVHERSWAAVLRVESGSDRFVFKAVGPVGRHEVPLLADVAMAQPRLAPELVAVAPDDGWLLMRDHGSRMADVAGIADQVALVEGLLPLVAELQRSTADLVDGWIAAGVPDRSPSVLPGLVDRLGLTAEEVATFARVCEQLGDGRAIDHADMHGHNVVVDAHGPRLIDWGDACIAHPLTAPLVPIEWIAGRLPARDVPRAVRRLVDAYAEPWGAAADRAQIGRAMWTGYLTRALLNLEQADDDGEAELLVRVWREKASLLGDPDALLLPSIRW